MKGKDRLGEGSANWQFAPPDQRPFGQAKALSSLAAASINVRRRKRRKLPVCAAAHSLLPARLPQNPLALEMLNALLPAAKKNFANRMAFCHSQPLYIMKGHHKPLR